MNIHKVKAQYVASGGGFTTAILQLYATPVHNTCRAFNAIINSLQNWYNIALCGRALTMCLWSEHIL